MRLDYCLDACVYISCMDILTGIYDSTGTVVVRYTYDAWGKLISITGQLANTVGVKNPLRYRGYYYDTEIGLYYLQSRYYDPETCHFINRDSYFIAGNDHIQGANMFSYCYNNPVMYSDPTGYEAADSLSLAFAVILGAGILSAALIEYLPFEQALSFASYIGGLDISSDGFIVLVTSIVSDLADGVDILLQETKLYGTPNSGTWVSKNTWRIFGPDGRALKDIDYKDNHPNIGTPHDHDWTWGSDGPTRSSPRKHIDEISANNRSSIAGYGLVAACALGLAVIAVNGFTGVGVADDFLAGPLLGGISKGLTMI